MATPSFTTPTLFQNRIILTFQSRKNYEYLYHLFYENLVKLGMPPMIAQSKLSNLQNTMMQFSSTFGAIHDIIMSDPISMRAKLQGGLDLWDEIKRINMIFYQDGMRAYLDITYAPVLQNRPLGQNYAKRTNVYGAFDPNAMHAINRGDPNAIHRSDPNAMYKSDASHRSDAILASMPNAIQSMGRGIGSYEPSRNIKENYDIEYEYKNPYLKLLDHVPTVGLTETNEDYAMTMFISDSLRPQGYEYFNDMGDNFNVLENRSDWSKKDGKQKYNKSQLNLPLHNTINDDFSNFNMANYQYSDDGIIDTSIQGIENSNEAKEYKSHMRYKEIPFWQKLSREGVDTDIKETLGFGLKESDNRVRGWNMDALRAKNGGNFDRLYGARNGNYN